MTPTMTEEFKTRRTNLANRIREEHMNALNSGGMFANAWGKAFEVLLYNFHDMNVFMQKFGRYVSGTKSRANVKGFSGFELVRRPAYGIWFEANYVYDCLKEIVPEYMEG